MNQTPILSSQDLRNRVAEFRAQRKQAADSGAPQDPTLAGVTTIPVQPDAENPNKLQTPGANGTNKKDAQPSDSLLTTDTNPSPSGSGAVPSLTNGTAADTAATGVIATATSKSAGFLANLKSLSAKSTELHAQLHGKQASAPAPAVTPTPAVEAVPAGSLEDALKQASEVFASVGELVCGDADGKRLVEQLLIKQAGQVQALQMLKEAEIAADVYARAGAIHEEQRAKQAAEDAAFQQYFGNLTPLEQHRITKLAAIQEQDAQFLASEDDAFWYTKGAAAAQAAMDQAEAAGAEPDPSQMAMPGGDGGMPPPEEILQILEMLVQSGKISPEEAQQLMQEIMGAEGGAPPEGAPPEGAVPEGGDIPPSEEEKAAAARLALCGTHIVQVPA
jgi:hypothetical protein